MPAIQTPRGRYFLTSAAPLEHTADGVVVTLSLEAASGIERIGFQCLLPPDFSLESEPALVEKVSSAVRSDFEVIREAALKSIRTERRLYRLVLAQRKSPLF